MKRSLFSWLRIKLYNLSVACKAWWYKNVYGMDIGRGVQISRKAEIDRGINPHGVHIGDYTRIASAQILTHDDCRNLKADVYIGKNCFLASRSIILPGVHIGDEVIVGAGAIVTKDVPSNSIVAGNPAKIIREGVRCGHYGRIIEDAE